MSTAEPSTSDITHFEIRGEEGRWSWNVVDTALCRVLFLCTNTLVEIP